MYDYYHGPRISIARLVQILAELPADAWLWPTPTGGLAVMTRGDPTGTYLGYIDTAYAERMMWADDRMIARTDGDGTPG